jgi:hypothetical protein
MAESNYSYRDPRRLARLMIWASRTVVVLHFLTAAAFSYDWTVLGTVEQGTFSSHEALVSSVRSATFYAETATYCSMLAIAVTFLLFFVWIYRTSANAHAMGADLNYGAGLSVGIFFVPGVNLFLPPMMMSELARASTNAPSWKDQKRSPLVPFWWSLQIIVAILSIVIVVIAPSHGAPLSEYRTYFVWHVLYKVPEILLYLVLSYLVGSISSNQQRQWHEMELAVTTFS